MSSEKEFWTGLTSTLERVAAALETIAGKSAPTGGSENGVKASRQSQAILWVSETGITDLGEIALRFGVTRRTVERWKSLRSAVDRIKGEAGGDEPVTGFMHDGVPDGISSEELGAA